MRRKSKLVATHKLENGRVIEVRASYTKAPKRTGEVHVSVVPMKVYSEGGMTVREYSAFSGYRSKLGDLNRYSDKGMQQLVDHCKGHIDELVRWVAEAENSTIVQP